MATSHSLIASTIIYQIIKLSCSMQLFSLLSITLVVLAIQFVNAVPINFDASDETNGVINEQNKLIDNESKLSKRKLPVEGILIGRRDYQDEGDSHDYPGEGIVLGKRHYPIEGILLGKRYRPHEGVLLGKRNFRL